MAKSRWSSMSSIVCKYQTIQHAAENERLPYQTFDRQTGLATDVMAIGSDGQKLTK